MHNFTETLHISFQKYQILHQKINETVEFVNQQDYKAAVITITELTSLLTDIKRIDENLYSLCNDRLIETHQVMWDKRTAQIETTLAFHHKIMPQLESIMAMQKAEIWKIRSGIRGMSCYHTGSKQTGKYIQNAT